MKFALPTDEPPIATAAGWWCFRLDDGGTIEVVGPPDEQSARAQLAELAQPPPLAPEPALEHRLAEHLGRLDPVTADGAAIVGAVLAALRPVDSATVSPATTSTAP